MHEIILDNEYYTTKGASLDINNNTFGAIHAALLNITIYLKANDSLTGSFI